MNEREDENDDKTEEPSDEKRRKFREEGNIASPKELLSAISLGMFLVVFIFVGPGFVKELSGIFARSWNVLNPKLLTDADLGKIAQMAFFPLIPWMVSGAMIVLLTPLIIGLVCTKFNWTWKPIEPKFNKMNPFSGIKKMFGTQTLIEAVKSTAKVLVIGFVIYLVTRSTMKEATSHALAGLPIIVGEWGDAIFRLMMSVAVSTVFLGVFDFGFNLWRIEQKMKMSRKQLKDESKEQEGDPRQKGLRRRLAREYAMRKTISEVSNATFIVTNPQHFAVALKYKKGMSAPTVIAKGQDFLALKIREIAKKNDIIIVENKALARTLYKTVKVGQEIPSSLYTSIVEVMKYIYSARGRDYFDRMDVGNAATA